MRKLVGTNIRQAFAGPDRADRAPSFCLVDSGRVDSRDREHFGFFALVRSIRAVLVGTRFLQAGDLLSSNDYCASAVVCYYTSALNATLAYLALEGRVFIDNPRGPRRTVVEPGAPMWEELWPGECSLLAVLSKSNTWSFEKRGRNHAVRWAELERVCDERGELPEPFMELFEYVLSYGPECRADFDDERDFIRKGTRAVREARHEAVYKGYGYDDFAVDLIMNRDGGGAGLDRKPLAFRHFAVQLGEQILVDLLDVASQIGDARWRERLPSTYLAIMTPDVFEIGDSEVDGAAAYSEHLVELYDLVFRTKADRRQDRPED